MATKKAMIMCVPKSLPDEHQVAAAITASHINPANRPNLRQAAKLVGERAASKEFIAALTTRYWTSGGVRLTVKFLDTKASDSELKARILSHMNAWSDGANIKFTMSNSGDADVRIARAAGDGYWSYLGTDIQHRPKDEPTMNLDSFTMETPESEYKRVVRHETGHTLGFPHEHMRREIVSRIDPQKATLYFERACGWSPAETKVQVLTPLEDVGLFADPTDTQSIMCYQLPGAIMRDGNPVPGGLDIDAEDREFAQLLYPAKLVTARQQKWVGTAHAARR